MKRSQHVLVTFFIWFAMGRPRARSGESLRRGDVQQQGLQISSEAGRILRAGRMDAAHVTADVQDYLEMHRNFAQIGGVTAPAEVGNCGRYVGSGGGHVVSYGGFSPPARVIAPAAECAESHRVPRPNWQEKVEQAGLLWHSGEQAYWDESAFYSFTAKEVDELECATNELASMALCAAQHVIDERLYSRLAIPEPAIELIERSWRAQASLYGRFDFAH